jgi:hypothetical protein
MAAPHPWTTREAISADPFGAPDACDLHEFPPERVVHREHHAHVELVLHDLSSIGISLILELSII